MTSSSNLDQMTPQQLRALAKQALQLLSQVDSMGQKIHRLETVNEQLAHELAILKRHKFAKRSEQISPDQGSLLRVALPAQFPRTVIHHEPGNTQCA